MGCGCSSQHERRSQEAPEHATAFNDDQARIASSAGVLSLRRRPSAVDVTGSPSAGPAPRNPLLPTQHGASDVQQHADTTAEPAVPGPVPVLCSSPLQDIAAFTTDGPGPSQKTSLVVVPDGDNSTPPDSSHSSATFSKQPSPRSASATSSPQQQKRKDLGVLHEKESMSKFGTEKECSEGTIPVGGVGEHCIEQQALGGGEHDITESTQLEEVNPTVNEEQPMHPQVSSSLARGYGSSSSTASSSGRPPLSRNMGVGGIASSFETNAFVGRTPPESETDLQRQLQQQLAQRQMSGSGAGMANLLLHGQMPSPQTLLRADGAFGSLTSPQAGAFSGATQFLGGASTPQSAQQGALSPQQSSSLVTPGATGSGLFQPARTRRRLTGEVTDDGFLFLPGSGIKRTSLSSSMTNTSSSSHTRQGGGALGPLEAHNSSLSLRSEGDPSRRSSALETGGRVSSITSLSPTAATSAGARRGEHRRYFDDIPSGDGHDDKARSAGSPLGTRQHRVPSHAALGGSTIEDEDADESLTALKLAQGLTGHLDNSSPSDAISPCGHARSAQGPLTTQQQQQQQGLHISISSIQSAYLSKQWQHQSSGVLAHQLSSANGDALLPHTLSTLTPARGPKAGHQPGLRWPSLSANGAAGGLDASPCMASSKSRGSMASLHLESVERFVQGGTNSSSGLLRDSLVSPARLDSGVQGMSSGDQKSSGPFGVSQSPLLPPQRHGKPHGGGVDTANGEEIDPYTVPIHKKPIVTTGGGDERDTPSVVSELSVESFVSSRAESPPALRPSQSSGVF